ncbi:unnamed protein product [Strongylus vulgaris]|uniref:Uncharacterized protein n=1 Tax=Strongylus vulgaris TaxID=40348 RepID=A0A3P7JCS4_STRVU|nr:unnamed protein product [Strongylus vulgaris]
MKGALHRVNSTIEDLRFDSARGIIEWAEPKGSLNPYEITVVSNSLSGESSISWNVSVEPSYIAEVNSVSKIDERSEMRIVGRVRGIAENLSVPVKIWIKEKDEEKPTEIVIRSNGTRFTYDYIPQTSGEFTVVASHPGLFPTSGGVGFTIPPLELAVDESEKGPIVHNAEHCDATMLRPKNGTVRIEQSGSDIRMIEDVEDWHDETVSLLRCDGKRELWRYVIAEFSLYPLLLIIQQLKYPQWQPLLISGTPSMYLVIYTVFRHLQYSYRSYTVSAKIFII